MSDQNTPRGGGPGDLADGGAHRPDGAASSHGAASVEGTSAAKPAPEEGRRTLPITGDGVRLPNLDMPIQDRACFCDARPEAIAPFRGIIEKFVNWARANSLWILGFGTGCGAIELRPLMTARFDAYRYGIQPRPTPRQSSVFIIGGYVSLKTLKRIVRSYEQMQNPKFVIGLGSCTINGGMYWDSYNTINRLDHYIPVDVYVAGCMPRPEAILAGFQKLKSLIKAGEAEGANYYAEHFDWYKENQKKIITDWNMPDYNW